MQGKCYKAKTDLEGLNHEHGFLVGDDGIVLSWKHSSFLYIYLIEPLRDIIPLGYINIYNPICRTWQ